MDENSKISELDAVVLNNCFEGWRVEAMSWLRKNDWLKPDQGLEGLTWGRWSRIFNRLAGFKRTVMPAVAALADRDKAVTEEKHCEERQRCRRMRQLCDLRPAEYDDLSDAKAPCPVQFKMVSNFLTDEGSIYFTKAGERIHGIFAFGDPRSGKTGAAWQAVENYWRTHPFTNVEWIKTVRFVSIAKSRHLGADSKQEFDKLFARLIHCDLLVLDDFGSEKLSESAEEVLFELIDTRTEEWRFTVITSNYDLRGVGKAFYRNQEKTLARLRQYFLPIRFGK